jgi:hypothetical protein
MRTTIATLLLAFSLAVPAVATSHRSGTSYHHRSGNHYGWGTHRSRVHRSTEAKAAFKRQQPCPSTGKSSGPCPGYVIDHVKPLACGGADDPSNMQWQTAAEGKAKDKWERIGCK